MLILKYNLFLKGDDWLTFYFSIIVDPAVLEIKSAVLPMNHRGNEPCHGHALLPY